ncbi:la-related protein 7-like [Daphnia pulex]|nr:la-related protein 7-like [Daphnia pulex]
MEFYFSDANLSKDRFMQNVIKDGPEIPLHVFMNFNKLRAMTEDLKEIAKALKFSKTLKLSEDETKVSRITPFRPKSQEEVDLCTVYVERLPPHASIEWITSIFSEYGVVAYVSLPKFKDATRIKGFAFVEFCDSESAAKAVTEYAASSEYHLLTEDPGQLCSIQAFNAESQQDEKGDEKKTSPKPETEEDESNAEPKSKRIKVEEETTEIKEGIATTIEETTVIKAEKEITSQDESKAITKKKKQPNVFKDEINEEALNLSLQVMSKKEWKRLRNKYLDMQRKCLRQIRMNARRQHNESRFDPVVLVEETKEQFVEDRSDPCPDFQPGRIVKIILDEPISDAKRFKSQVKCQEGVTYVEAQDCCKIAFVRCTDDAAAQSLVVKKIWSQSEILQGEEERDYWKKIEENRIKKRDKSSRPKKSGAERARKQKESIIDADQPGYPTRAIQHKNLHIRFDGEDDD